MATVTEHRSPAPQRPGTGPSWGLVILLVLLVAAAAFAGGWFAHQPEDADVPVGLADAASAEVVADQVAALSRGDYDAVAATLTADARLYAVEEGELSTFVGRDEVMAAFRSLGAVDVEVASASTMIGSLVSTAYRASDSHGFVVAQVVGGRIRTEYVVIS